MAASTILQASAVAIEGMALLIEGVPGSGKSSLTLALIERGATLIGDDGVTLTQTGNAILVSPPPNIAGKLEIRNVGIVDLPTTNAPLGLVLMLDDNAARYRSTPELREILGLNVPALPFTPGAIAPAERAIWALRVHGQKHSLAIGEASAD